MCIMYRLRRRFWGNGVALRYCPYTPFLAIRLIIERWDSWHRCLIVINILGNGKMTGLTGAMEYISAGLSRSGGG